MGLRNFIWQGIKKLFFLFDAEAVHRFIVSLIHLGTRFRNYPLVLASGFDKKVSHPREVLGMEFLSPVGLAAGFDKNAEIVEGLPSLGFGFVEVGTVTPRPQPGNPLPRLFRNVAQGTLFNRMGFNNLGAEIVSVRMKAIRSRGKLPPLFRIGVNLGKNKDTQNEDSANDYAKAASYFEDLADYLVVNVSSPNTPGLRSLQTEESLKAILGAILEVTGKWRHRPPLLVKLAPETEIHSLISSLEKQGVDGWILTNTLGGDFHLGQKILPGGWSGSVLTEISRNQLIKARQLTQKPIISVGGIMTVEEARLRLEKGADLIQLYTGWIYQGPSFPVLINKSPRQ